MIRSKVKPLISSLSSLNHQFLQRCSVSKTAKGKGKGKDAAPLKRSIIPKKKSAAKSPTATGGRLNQAGERLNKMVESCLNSPTPIRHLSAKERLREAEREKLGLISKNRQRELDMIKAAAKKKSGEGEGGDSKEIMGTPGFDLISLGLVDVEKIPKYEMNVEDGRRLAKEYSRVLMRRHRARQAAESSLLRLKKEAIDALPDGLREKAMIPDFTPFPANRYMATLTPPIEGYVDKIKEAASKSVGKAKLR